MADEIKDLRIAFETRCGTCVVDKPGWRRGPLYPSYGELVLCERCRGTGYVRAGLMTMTELRALLAVSALPTTPPKEPTPDDKR